MGGGGGTLLTSQIGKKMATDEIQARIKQTNKNIWGKQKNTMDEVARKTTDEMEKGRKELDEIK